MSRKQRKLTVLIVTILMVISAIAISILLYPSWLNDPKNLLGMVITVIVGVLGVSGFVYTWLQDNSEYSVKKMSQEVRHNVREHLQTGLLAGQKNLLNSFLDEYLGNAEPVPFGGRDEELASLDQWLYDPHGNPYLLLTAPAGRGKTHMVVRWAAQLISKPKVKVRVILVPISIRFNTAQPKTYLHILARALAHFYNDPLQETAKDTYKTMRDICAEYLSRKEKPAKEYLLVILDGLDESTDPDIDKWRELMGDLPCGTRVLLSTRLLGKEADASGWLTRLGLKASQVSQLTIPPLNVTGLHQVLESMGNPLKGYAQEEVVLKELLRLTGGDPLLVRLYVQDLHARLKPDQLYGKRIEVNNILAWLENSEPNLKGYFEGWWEDQRKQWKAQGEDICKVEDDLRDFLCLLATAVAPLKGHEVAALLGNSLQYPYQQERLVNRAPRIIIGSSRSGYTLSHPSFGIFFYEAMGNKERAIEEDLFIAVGARMLDGLKSGIINPSETLPYFIVHTKDHLVKAIKDGRAEPQNLYDLLCEPWLRAHEYHVGTPASFLEDVDAAWEVASQQPCGDTSQQVLAVLCFSSVATLSSNIPSEVICKAYQMGELNLVQALTYIRQNNDLKRRAIGLSDLSKVETNQRQQENLQQEALEVALQIKDPFKLANALADIAQHLPNKQQLIILQQSLEVATQIKNSEELEYSFSSIKPNLPTEDSPDILYDTIEVARHVEISVWRDSVLSKIASQLPTEQALKVANQITNSDWQASALMWIALKLPFEQQTVILNEALEVAYEVEDLYQRVRILAWIAHHLPTYESVILEKALEFSRQIEDPYWNGSALAKIIPYLPIDCAIEVIRGMDNFDWRARSLTWVALKLPTEQQTPIFNEALEVAFKIEKSEERVVTLAKIAQYLPADQALEIACKIEDPDWHDAVLAKTAPHMPAEKALRIVQQIENSSWHARALVWLAPYLPIKEQSSIFYKALEITLQIGNTRSRASTLVDIAPHLPVEFQLTVTHELFNLSRYIGDSEEQISVLAQIAQRLPAKQKTTLSNEILKISRKIDDSFSRDRALAAIAPTFPFKQALKLARQIEELFWRGNALAEIIRRMPSKQKQAILNEALDVAYKIEYSDWREGVLSQIAPSLPIEQALDIAKKASNSFWKARVLAVISHNLQPEQRKAILDEALEAANQVEEVMGRSSALGWIAPNLPIEKALEVIRQIEDPSWRSTMLIEIVQDMPSDQRPFIIQEALEVAYQMEYIKKASSLAEIAPYLPAEKAFDVAHQVEEPSWRAHALAGIIPIVPSEKLPELWQEATQFHYTNLLGSMAKRWIDLCATSEVTPQAALSLTLRAFQYSQRTDVLYLISAMTPVIEQLGGETEISKTVKAIQSVCKWWP